MRLNPHRPTDLELIRDIMAGGTRRERALGWFVNDKSLRNTSIFFASKYRKVLPADADDLFARAAQIFAQTIAQDKFRSERGLRTYFVRVATHEWMNMCRTNDKDRNAFVEFQEEAFINRPEYQIDPAKPTSEERWRLFEQIIAETPIGKRCQQMLILRARGYENPEIEELVGTTDAARDFYKCHQKFKGYLKIKPDIFDRLK